MNSELKLVECCVPSPWLYIPVKADVLLFKQKGIINPIFYLIMLRANDGNVLIANLYLCMVADFINKSWCSFKLMVGNFNIFNLYSPLFPLAILCKQIVFQLNITVNAVLVGSEV